jgi:tripartite-type tricarboxylate transporter receptor subunit TctC
LARPKLQCDSRTDFEPIGLIAGTPILVLAKKDFPAKDLKEFVSYVKANETKLNNVQAGVGSVSFTTCLLLNSIIGVKPTTKRLLDLGSDIPGKDRRGPAALSTLVKSEVDKWGKVIKEAGAEVN